MPSLYLVLLTDLHLTLKISEGFSHREHQCQNIEQIYCAWMQALLLQFSNQFLNDNLNTSSSSQYKSPLKAQ